MFNDWPDGLAHVQFSLPAVAGVIGIPPERLAYAMVEAVAGALVRDAWQLLDMTMQEHGLRPGTDPYPDEWPTVFLATVTVERLFPGLHDSDQPDTTH